MIQVLQFGLIEYEAALKLQQTLVELRKQNRIADLLLLLEHPAVITLGRNAKPANIIASKGLLAQRGVEVYECDRGGDVTFHGPGQLVGYPIFDLRGELRAAVDASGNRKMLGAVEYMRRLEEVLVRTCGDLGIPCSRIPKLTGVWTQAEPQRKIAALGVHISRGVTSHGFALNVNTDLEYYKLIVPCGISDKPVTSMQQEMRAQNKLAVGATVNMQDVAHAVSRNFGRVFAQQTLWLESLEDLMQNAVPANQDTPVKPPAELRRLHKEDELYPA